MILNNAQASAAYAAMCILNNVDGIVNLTMSGPERSTVKVQQSPSGHEISVSNHWGGATRDSEKYADQFAFAVAYKVA